WAQPPPWGKAPAPEGGTEAGAGGDCPPQLEAPVMEPSLYTVKALLILDSLGQRLLAKYYDGTFPTAKEQAAFEKSIFNKTHRAGGEIACLEGLTIVYRSSIDLFFYVVGGCQENELMLSAVLTCLLDTLSHLLRKEVEKRLLLDNMEGTFLVVDEIVDRGVILESDPQQVIQRLSMRVSGAIPPHGLPPPSSAFPPPSSSPSLPSPGPGAGSVRLRPLRLPGRRLGAEGQEGRWWP
uniref:Coatomer subunit zeta n=1 Tax=Calidris pygmaea TaxID=425635 RepID=A0A8C3KGS3_9CHAR